MNYSTYRFTLDIHKTRSQVSIPVMYKDTWVRLYVNLTDGGKPYQLAEGCTAVLCGKKADGKALVHDCDIIDDNTRIVYTFKEQTASALGPLECEIRLYSKEDGLHLTTPSFVILVEERVVDDNDVIDSEVERSAIDRIFENEVEREEAEAERKEAEATRQVEEAKRKEAYEKISDFIDDSIPFRGEGKRSLIQHSDLVAQDDWAAALNKDTAAYGGGSFASGGGSVAGVSYEKFLELFKLADSESSKALYEAARARSSNNMNVSTPQDAGYLYWYAHAEGDTSKAYNRSSHAEGNHTEAHGHASHAEGENAKAMGDASHAEGASTVALKRASHAEGSGTHAEGEASHSEGDQTYATAIAAHAEGIRSRATASGSHAEGRSNATGQYSHSEGEDTHADGYASHAEGYGTHATQNSAHSEGHSTHATAIAAHAEGYGTKAASKYQHVQGKFNVEDNAEKYAHIVGWGTKDIPLNIHTLSTNGTAMYLGDVYANETKKLATVDEAKAAAADAVAAVVGSSKETLNTLEELGKALGEDPNFATTVTAEIGKKLDKVNTKFRLYATDGNGDQTTYGFSVNLTKSSVPMRKVDGAIETGWANAKNDAVPLEQMNEALAEKVGTAEVDALVDARLDSVLDAEVEEKVSATMDGALAGKADIVSFAFDKSAWNLPSEIVMGPMYARYSTCANGDGIGLDLRRWYLHHADRVSVEQGGSLPGQMYYVLEIPFRNDTGQVWQTLIYFRYDYGNEMVLSSPLYTYNGKWCVDIATINGDDARIHTARYNILESTVASDEGFTDFYYRPLLGKPH